MPLMYHKERKVTLPWMHYKFDREIGCAWVNPETNWLRRNIYKLSSDGAQKGRSLSSKKSRVVGKNMI
eukprot:9371880-Ditylum_brightwellii.AAC.1